MNAEQTEVRARGAIAASRAAKAERRREIEALTDLRAQALRVAGVVAGRREGAQSGAVSSC
jgi:hypothetical protein